MAKPAIEARLAAAAKGFTRVIVRGNNHIITKNPTTGKCCFDAQVGGGWHYNGDQETDTAWEADSDSNYLKMVKAGYNLRARKLFNAGDLIQWTDPISGQYVKFQPQNFQWIDGTTGSNSVISIAQAVASPSIDDDKLTWPAAFGVGRHFRYTAAPTKLIKHLIIDSAANLPACPAWITNPWLELTFTLTPSSGVTMYVDGGAWDQATTKTTANAIEFRLQSGEVVWSIAAPLAYDSSPKGTSCHGQIKLYVNKKIKYAAVRFPKSFFDAAAAGDGQGNSYYPVYIDPTIDKDVSANADDFSWSADSYNFFDSNMLIGSVDCYHLGAMFRGITIPSGATITSAYTQLYRYSGDGTVSSCRVYFNDVASPTVPTTYYEADWKTLTTNYATWNVPNTGTWLTGPDCSAGIQELLTSYGEFSNGNMLMLLKSYGDTNYVSLLARNLGSSYAPKLHIEYTEAAAAKPAANVIWIG